MMQSRKSQRKIIEAATKDGTIDTLYWYMVIDCGWNKQIPAAINDWVPVVKVAPDPAVTEHDAHLMLEIIRHYSPGMILRLELTARDILEDLDIRYFEFGDIDLVCPSCGAVGWESCICKPTLWRMEERMVAA